MKEEKQQLLVWKTIENNFNFVILGVMANPLGVLLANVLSPQLVKDPSHVLYLNIIVAVPAVVVALLATAGVNRSYVLLKTFFIIN